MREMLLLCTTVTSWSIGALRVLTTSLNGLSFWSHIFVRNQHRQSLHLVQTRAAIARLKWAVHVARRNSGHQSRRNTGELWNRHV